jgi:hypothetical protein
MINKLRYILIIFCSTLLITTQIQAQLVSKVGTTAAPFLKVGAGARALGMGEAYVSLAEDVTALYWNPAGLGYLDRNEVIFAHYDYFAEMNYEFGGVAISIPELGTIGASFTYLGSPDFERTTELRPEGTGEMVSSSFYAFAIGYGRKLTERFAIGGNIKYVRENLWQTSADGFALDLGVMYRTIFEDIKIAMSISNFGSSMKLEGRNLTVQHDIDEANAGNNGNINATLDTDEFSMPIFFRFGISSNITRDFFGIENQDFIISMDALHPNDNKEYVNIGAEYKYANLLALRGGYRQLFLAESEREGGLTFGIGLEYDFESVGVILDYAAIDYGRFDYLNKFSFILSF